MTDLSREDVQQILDLIEKSEFDYFELQSGDLKLTVSKTGLPRPGQAPQAPQSPPGPPPPPSGPPTPTAGTAHPAPPSIAPPPAAAPPTAAPPAAGTMPVKAPMVGTFYSQSEPGAPPYVQVGAHVERDTTMGLVEVMKVFTAVFPPVSGTVETILVSNAEFVEFGQDLFYIRPDEPAAT